MSENNILGVILAGGKSKRFGEDKNLAKLGSISLIEHTIYKIREKFKKILIIANNDLKIEKKSENMPKEKRSIFSKIFGLKNNVKNESDTVNLEQNIKNKMVIEALGKLKPREKDIIIKRRLTDDAKTLEELSKEYNVSRERIRQIETRAFEKLQIAVKLKAKDLQLLESNEN